MLPDATNGASSELNTSNDEERDEVLEVQRMSSNDTRRIRIWRLLLALSLIATATLITGATYRELAKEQEQNFQAAVSTTKLPRFDVLCFVHNIFLLASALYLVTA